MINKNALLRFKVINDCLDSHSGYTITELVDACNERFSQTPGCAGITVKSRQVLFDMEHMKSIYGVEIMSFRDEKDHRFVRFRYSDNTKNIYGDKLQENDYQNLEQALWILESLVGLPYVQKAAESLRKRIGGDYRTGSLVSIESNTKLRNFDKIKEYYGHILRKHPLKVTYMAGYENEMTFLFQPYFLKQFNNRWFLFGWNYDVPALWNLAVDRIVAKKVDMSRFSQTNPPRENDTDFSTYFNDIIGVSKKDGVAVEHIVIKADISSREGRNDWFRLMTKPIHGSQKPIDECEGTLSIDVKPNPELYAALRQFEHIEVVSPSAVRDEFLRRLSSIQEQYKQHLNVQFK